MIFIVDKDVPSFSFTFSFLFAILFFAVFLFSTGRAPVGQARVYDEAGLRYQVLAFLANDAIRLHPGGL